MQTLPRMESYNLLPKGWLSGLRLLAFGLLIWLLILVGMRAWPQPDPYVHQVLQLQGNPARGASLFALNCAACHGEDGHGRVGPSLHGLHSHRSSTFIIEQVTSGNTPPMPQFQPDPQEMADLLSYLESL